MKKLSNKKGEGSLLSVVFVTIMAMTFISFTNIIQHTSVVNEFQMQMDMSGVNALNSNINTERLSIEEDISYSGEEQEELRMNILETFEEELYGNAPQWNDIQNVRIIHTDVSFTTEERSADLGLYTQHILLDAVVAITVPKSSGYNPREADNLMEEFNVGFGGTSQVTAIRESGENYLELMVHNQTRLQY